MKKMFKIYVSEMGKYADPASCSLVAVFTEQKSAEQFISDNFGKGRFARKDIVVREAPFADDPASGKLAAVISAIGESLPLDETD